MWFCWFTGAPQKMVNFHITILQEPESLYSLISLHGFAGEMPEHGPSFCMHRSSFHQSDLLKGELGWLPRPLYKGLWETEHFQLAVTRTSKWERNCWRAAAKGSHHGNLRALICKRTHSFTYSAISTQKIHKTPRVATWLSVLSAALSVLKDSWVQQLISAWTKPAGWLPGTVK